MLIGQYSGFRILAHFERNDKDAMLNIEVTFPTARFGFVPDEI